MHHRHDIFRTAKTASPAWAKPAFTTATLTAEELAAVRANPESWGAMAAKLKASGRV